MKVRTKLILGFSVIVVLLWGIGWFAITSFGNLNSQFSAVEDTVLPGTLAMKDVENNANKAYDETMAYILTDDTQAREAAFLYLSRLQEILDSYFTQVATDTEKLQADLAMATKITDFNFSLEALIQQKDDGVDPDELLRRNQITSMPSLLALQQEVSTRIDLYTEELTSIKTDFNKTYKRSQQALYFSIGLMTLLAIIGATIITRSIVRPLHALHKGTEIIAEGNLECKLGTKAKDEIGQLSRAFDQMTQSLNSSMTSIDSLNSEIAERKKLEKQIQKQVEELKLANDKLMELDKMKDTFLSTVSHELRTPLTSIKSFAEILLTYDEDRDTQREFLTIINDESDRLTKLINDFLDLSKIEAGRMQWETVELSLTPVIKQAINITQAIAKEKTLEVSFTETPNLPNVFCDKDRLVQVVTNLLSNAIKFNPESGEITVKTEVVAEKGKQDSSMVVTSVSDSGIGIAPEDFGAVFEKFKQVGDTLTDKPKGTGLGLPISKEIIEHYGGEIWVESQLRKGSTFFFSLPVAKRIEESKMPEPHEEEEVVEVIKNKKGKKILVVDDEENIRIFLSHEFKRKGYTVFVAANGKEALDMARKQHPDLITLDVQMPDISGFDVTSVLKNDNDTKDIPILILSVIEDKDRAYKLGVNDYMTKPVDNEELLNKVNQLISKNRKNILIVDDDKSLVKSVRYHLERRGYLVSAAYDGMQALEMIEKKHPDLILLDIMMPVIDGFEVIKTLKADPDTASIRIVLMTGIEIDGGRVKALSIGATDLINKGDNFNKLYETVDNILMDEVSV